MIKNSIINLKKENFEEEVLQSEIPVLVDFWAPWCGPCRAIAPILEQVSDEMHPSVKISKLNVDDESEIAGKYNIMSIPTMIIFKGGEPVEKIIGLRQKDELIDTLNKHVG